MEINEHTVAIVNFEGALKREIRRTRMELQKVDTLIEEYLGWGKVHGPKAIGYDKIPSDDTIATPPPSTDEIPF